MFHLLASGPTRSLNLYLLLIKPNKLTASCLDSSSVWKVIVLVSSFASNYPGYYARAFTDQNDKQIGIVKSVNLLLKLKTLRKQTSYRRYAILSVFVLTNMSRVTCKKSPANLAGKVKVHARCVRKKLLLSKVVF